MFNFLFKLRDSLLLFDLDLFYINMAGNEYTGVTASLERWIWYVDRELRSLRHEMEQDNARRDIELRHLHERIAAHQQTMLGDGGFSEELHNVTERVNEYGQNVAELRYAFTRHCTAVMGDARLAVDVEDLQSHLTHLEKEVQDLHVKIDKASNTMRQVLGELASIRTASSDTLAPQLTGAD